MSELFPRTTVAGVSLPRMLIGTNWMLGWSHRSSAADKLIENNHPDEHAILPMYEAFASRGVDAVMGTTTMAGPHFARSLRLYEDKHGKALTLIDTPAIDVSDNAEARKSAEATIKECAKNGATFCLIHHSSAEQLVNKNLQAIPRLPDYLSMIRDAGMIPGLSAHMPELVLYSDAQGYDVETYIQLYNCLGFLMQVEVETIARVIHNAKKPVMTIKSMAAGRCTPYVGLNFSYNTIRECDMVTVGCMTPMEVAEDVEIGLAAIERRFPDFEGRSSPNKTEAVKGAMDPDNKRGLLI